MDINNLQRANELYAKITEIENFESEFADTPDMPIVSIKLASGNNYNIPSLMQDSLREYIKNIIISEKENILNQFKEL